MKEKIEYHLYVNGLHTDIVYTTLEKAIEKAKSITAYNFRARITCYKVDANTQKTIRLYTFN